ncbi:hypothetical protein, partial [Streptomyces katrae]|uniref:hypothetical protein n=1 Tax=Streptomyces katrae TaxID=68223 RepID=UPI0012FF0A1C
MAAASLRCGEVGPLPPADRPTDNVTTAINGYAVACYAAKLASEQALIYASARGDDTTALAAAGTRAQAALD